MNRRNVSIRTVLAAEALRKARATMDCWDDPGDCYCGELGEDFSRAPQGDLIHRFAPSALLDGFSVEEITAAEEALA